MARNIEIKAALTRDEVLAIKRIAPKISDFGPEILLQTDTFFHVNCGRLKLREFANGSAELIAYDRPDQTGPKSSDYERVACPNPEELRSALTRSLGTRGRVVKRRELYLLGQTRIHLDTVESLGEFLELEVVMESHQNESAGVEEANRILKQLGIDTPNLISGAYIDLIESKPSTHV